MGCAWGVVTVGFLQTPTTMVTWTITSFLTTSVRGQPSAGFCTHHCSVHNSHVLRFAAEILRPSQKGVFVRRNLVNYADKDSTPRSTTSVVAGHVSAHDAQAATIITKHIAELAVADVNHVAASFKKYDGFLKGYITPADFRRALEECGVRLTDMQAARLMPLYDKNHDQRVQYKEFTAALADHMKQQLATQALEDAHNSPGPARLFPRTAGTISSPIRSPMRNGAHDDHDRVHTPRRGDKLQASQTLKAHHFTRPRHGPLSGRRPMASAAPAPQAAGATGADDSDHVETLMAKRLFSKFSKVQQAFRMFDDDRSGIVSSTEFRLALAALGFEMTDAEFSKLVEKYDKNGDGTVSYVEFNRNIGKVLDKERGAGRPDQLATARLGTRTAIASARRTFPHPRCVLCRSYTLCVAHIACFAWPLAVGHCGATQPLDETTLWPAG